MLREKLALIAAADALARKREFEKIQAQQQLDQQEAERKAAALKLQEKQAKQEHE